MAHKTFTLKVKTGEKDGKNYWDRCGVAFLNLDEHGQITSIKVRHNMFPDVDMVAFPPRDKETDDDS